MLFLMSRTNLRFLEKLTGSHTSKKRFSWYLPTWTVRTKIFAWQVLIHRIFKRNITNIAQVFFARGSTQNCMLFLMRGAKMQAFASLYDWRESGFWACFRFSYQTGVFHSRTRANRILLENEVFFSCTTRHVCGERISRALLANSSGAFFKLIRLHCFQHIDGIQQTNLRPGNKTSGLPNPS